MLSTKLFDHTILKADATRKDVKRVCDEAMAYSFCSVCVNSYYVPYVANLLQCLQEPRHLRQRLP